MTDIDMLLADKNVISFPAVAGDNIFSYHLRFHSELLSANSLQILLVLQIMEIAMKAAPSVNET